MRATLWTQRKSSTHMFPSDSAEQRPGETEQVPAAAPVQSQPQPQPQAQPRNSARRVGFVKPVTIASVALFGALIGVAADRWAVANINLSPIGVSAPTVTTGPKVGPVAAPNGGGTTAQAAPTSVPAADSTQAAIQQVIQHGDEEQAQAFANNDP